MLSPCAFPPSNNISPQLYVSKNLNHIPACQVYTQRGQRGPAISTLKDFKAFRNLPSLRCHAQIGTGGRQSDLLDTEAKLNTFEKTLPEANRAFFQQIRQSKSESIGFN